MTNDRHGRGPRLLRTLSGQPETVWPGAVIHHGARVLLLVVVAVIITALFPPVAIRNMDRHELGTLVEEDIIAEAPFAVPKSADELSRERDDAAAAVPPTFDYRPEASDSMALRVDRFFVGVDSAVAIGDGDALERFLSRVGIRAQPAQLALLTEESSRAVLRAASLRAATEILPRGVIESEDDITTDRVAVQLGEQDQGYLDRSRLMIQREFLAEAEGSLGATPLSDATDLLRLILIRWQEYNYTLNVVATEVDREQARQAVGTTKESILIGEAIVRANQQIREADLERLTAYEAQLLTLGLVEDSTVSVLPFIGFALIASLLMGVFGMLVFFFRAEVYTNFVWLLLQASMVVGYFLVAWVIEQNQFSSNLLPIAFVALGVAVLWDGRMALVLVLMVALLTGTLPPFDDYSVVLTIAVGGGAAALGVRAVRRRAQTWIFVAIIAAAYGAMTLSLSLVHGPPQGGLLMALFWGTANATGSAIVAMGFLPVFEWITGITTDQTLLEWSDPNRTLLKRLSMEAPGTHSHSIQVANLAEAGATAIGANGLLCRVGAYYHDIGKVLKPQYFIENQPEGRNPHDKLKPSTSAQVVIEHVTEGFRLAVEGKVPHAISDFIPEHHGTQRISYFYQKALDDADDVTAVDPSPFTYPGPRPRSRETAICMLADSVESATRVLQDATPERVRELVHNLVESKIRDGQLNDTDLTLREIATVEDQFVKMVSGMYHHRIDYPTTRHLTEAPGNGGGTEAGKTSTEPAQTSTEANKRSTESGKRSTESGIKSTESGKRSTESGIKSTESAETSTEGGRTKAAPEAPNAKTVSEDPTQKTGSSSPSGRNGDPDEPELDQPPRLPGLGA